MIFNWEHLRLRVEVVDRGGVVATSDEPQGPVLNQLKATNGRIRVLRIDDRGRIVEVGTDEGLKGQGHTLLVVAKGRVRKGAKNT